MAKKQQEVRRKPATTPEEIENECINLAFEVAREQLINRTASSQVITQFVRAGSQKQQAEIDKLKGENELLKAKVEALESQKRTEDVYVKALAAMRTYAGYGGDEDEYEY